MTTIEMRSQTSIVLTGLVFLIAGCAAEPSKDHAAPAESPAVAGQASGSTATENVPTTNGTEKNGTAENGVAESMNVSPSLIQPDNLVYQGAFRLPEGSNESNWEYSGYAMTYYPAGDPRGPDDGHPGSLFAVGHDHQQQISEIAIPAPVLSQSKDVSELNTAQTLQPFQDIRGDFYKELEIPRAGLEYLPAAESQGRGKLHFAWGQHFENDRAPSHGWCDLDLSKPRSAGPWFLGNYTNYITNDYMFEIPEPWAARHAPAMRLATGRFRDGTWGGLGPALVAYCPGNESAPPASRSTLSEVQPLLLYGVPQENDVQVLTSADRKMNGFKEADEWSGGAWLTVADKSAVILVGTKALGKCWYGYANGVEFPTSGAPGSVYPKVPEWPYNDRGWWSEKIQAQVLFFDPGELAAVARGDMETWEPQPYAVLNLDPYLFDPSFNPERQKRYLLGAAAFDRARGLLYVVERRSDEEKSLIHVFLISPKKVN